MEKPKTHSIENSEIFIWVAKNLLNKNWDYDWLDYSKEHLILAFFRILNELKKIEPKGNRLKNIALEILNDNEYLVLKDIIQQSEYTFLSKIYDLYTNVDYLEESDISLFHSLIKEKYPDFKATSQEILLEDWEDDVEKFIVSKEGFDKKQEELKRMINVEMINLTKELSNASDVSGDVRENVEYNALMEKQTILKMSINKLQDEIKKAKILLPDNISNDKVNIGCNVTIEDIDLNDTEFYTILGPWDADFEKRVLSYRSPIAKALLGKKIDQEISLKLGEQEKKYRISSIEKYNL